jgi:membrane-associated protein
LPGDSLLFTAGFIASQGYLNIVVLTVGCFVSAVIGDTGGYYIGHRFGRKLFSKEDSLFFHKDHLKKAEDFYEKHGGKTIIIARFMPVIRAFAPVVAGVGSMKYSTFLFYNVFGAFLWAICITVAGYFLGRISFVQEHFEKFVFLIIFVSVAPAVYHLLKEKPNRDGILRLLRLKK